MDMAGKHKIAAPRDKVWLALNDPTVLRRAVPGCESMEKLDDTTFEAVVTQKIGPIKARFKGKVTLADLDPPNSYTLHGEGSGGAAGFAKGHAEVRLEPDGDATQLVYQVKATVGGKIAQIGQRLVDQTAKKLADEFFTSFGEVVEGPAPAEPVAAAAPASEAPPPDLAPALSPVVWVGALVVLVLVLAFLAAIL